MTEYYRGTCVCGWAGPLRLDPNKAKKDSDHHAAMIGHFPPPDEAVAE
jgi:hypothetical protein